MKTLDEIGLEHKTDKSSLNHHYLSLYELLFEKWRLKNINILEIGIQFGCSMKTWEEYFPYATVTGIDSIDNNFQKTDRISLKIGEAYCKDTVNQLGVRFQIIIDDGSHFPYDQMMFVRLYLPLLTEDGLLIVEDVPTREIIAVLANELPDGYTYTALEMPLGQSIVDSRVFIAWKRNAISTRQQFEQKLEEVLQRNASRPFHPPEPHPQHQSVVSGSCQSDSPEPAHSNLSPS